MVLNATLIVRGTCLYFALLNPIGGQILMRFHKALIDLRQEGITSKAIFDDSVLRNHTLDRWPAYHGTFTWGISVNDSHLP